MMKIDLFKRDVIEVARCRVADASAERLDKSLRSGLRGVDPSVVPALAAVAELRHAIPRADGDRIGVIWCGTAYPRRAAEAVRRELQSNGRVSPTSFINANAGAAVSICCTKLALRGPTMALTMSGSIARRVAELLAAGWLRRRHADHVIMVVAEFGMRDEIVVDARLLACSQRRETPQEPLAAATSLELETTFVWE